MFVRNVKLVDEGMRKLKQHAPELKVLDISAETIESEQLKGHAALNEDICKNLVVISTIFHVLDAKVLLVFPAYGKHLEEQQGEICKRDM